MLFNLLLLILTKLPLAFAQIKARGYDNDSPRDQQTALVGWGKRALAAHQNAIETIPVFGLALLTAAVLQVPEECIHLCGGGFVISRVLFQIAYLKDLSTLRSLCWVAGYGFCLALVVMAL